MKRDLKQFEQQTYDLLVIGGGIYGACTAWEAAQRGLSVALFEKDDFGSGTSANSLKVIHGGFRYLQNLDFARIRESIHERRALFKIAPHLVHPLPVIIPTYGHGIKGREVLSLALRVNDLIGFDRNRLDDPQKHIPRGRAISREECLRLLPGIPAKDLTGGVIFYDAQVYNSERLVLAYLRSAEKAGAQIANYVRVTGFLREKNRVTGVQATDVLGGSELEVKARMVVNTGGPWVDWIRSYLDGGDSQPGMGLAKAINIITRPLFEGYAVGIPGRKDDREPAAAARRSGSYLFAAPWRGCSVIGTIYAPYDGAPDRFKASERDVRELLDAFNHSYPASGLQRKDIAFVHAGLLPMHSVRRGSGAVNLLRHYRILDSCDQGVEGLLSVVGVKYTTARDVAEKVIDRVFQIWGHGLVPSRSSSTPLYGGQISRFEAYLSDAIARRPLGLEAEDIRNLVYNYGSAYPEVLSYFQEQENVFLGEPQAHRAAYREPGNHPFSNYPEGPITGERQVHPALPGESFVGSPLDPTPAGSPVFREPNGENRSLVVSQALLKAQTLYAVHEEMAQKLGDIVFRRTELGTAGHPGEESLRFCAEVMGRECGWSPETIGREIQEVNQTFRLDE